MNAMQAAENRVGGVVRAARGGSLAWFAFVALAFTCLFAIPDAGVARPGHSAGTEPTESKAMPQLNVIDPIVEEAIRDKQIPGAVVIVGHDGEVVYRKAFGSRAIEPHREPMTVDTIFDLASLTKVLVTTTAVMQLMEQGKVRLNDPVAKYLPEFAQNGKEDITVRQLLVHFSGLAPDLDLAQQVNGKVWEGKETAYRMAFEAKPETSPGAALVYSDINFIVLGALVEKVTGETLDSYAAAHIFAPLKMTETRYLPPASWKARIAPTEEDENKKMLRGVVHDPTARRMGGVAGNAGVFGTADDLAKFAQALLIGGAGVLSPLAVEKMTTPQQPPTATSLRGFGWDIDSPYSANRGDLLPVGSYGHTGFTGTSLWIDPTTKTYIVILTNAVHMDDKAHPAEKGSAVALRSKIATAVAAALPLTADEQEKLRWESITGYNEAQSAARHVAVRNGSVKTGIDVLEEHGFEALRAKSTEAGTAANGTARKIGLLTNQTGVDSSSRRTIDVLATAPGIALTAIFSPEHGVTGSLDTTNIGNTKDAATGVPVYSVYGATDAARRPSLDVLKGLDAVVIDIQDAGVRFYTYETTLGYFLEAAAKANVEVIVLDRPNPITGSFVQGPIATAPETFTNYFPIPLRHGMTFGELAQMFNEERAIHARLRVVAMEGWLRGDWYDSTGLSWVNPSPNLRSLTEATLYPGVALIEGANVSVGRGTDTPFEVVGAPWIKSRDLAAYLNERMISGVRFVPITFTPTSSNFSGERCEGVNVIVTSRNTLDAPELGIELASALHKLYPSDFHMEKMAPLLANSAVFDALTASQDPRRIAQDWQEDLEKFESSAKKYQIYK
jgi:uncharacterized protein YbbC (DUF1343 family)/CubicO group peptidase (beta-lactamase class C family)